MTMAKLTRHEGEAFIVAADTDGDGEFEWQSGRRFWSDLQGLHTPGAVDILFSNHNESCYGCSRINADRSIMERQS